MRVKKMVVSKKINVSTKNLFSLQLKKALFYAFIEAKKYGVTTIDSQLLLFGLLKTSDSSVNHLFNQIYKRRLLSSSAVAKILSKLRINFQIKSKATNFSNDRTYPNFSRPVKRLLFFLLRSGKSRQTSIITSVHVLNYLLRHKYVCKFIKEALIT